jgi:hypothetical protein
MKRILTMIAFATALSVAKADEPTDQEIRAAKVKSVNNLKQLGLAMHFYHDANGHFPNNTADAKANLLLSWRVLLLPYVEQEELYKQFKLDEAWDGPNNKKLIEKMPAIFEIPLAKTAKGETHYRGFSGTGALFEKGKKIHLRNMTDGSSNTAMIVEAEKPCVWTRPDDLPFDMNKDELPKLGLPVLGGGFRAVAADGAAVNIKPTITKEMLKYFIHMSDGHVVRLP